MDVLEIIRDELKQVLHIRQVAVEYVTALPNCQENLAMGHHFSISLLDNQPCWIEWSEYLGAWISTDGADIKVCILEDARGLDSGELTLGFTSVLTGVCLNLQGQVAIHANAVALKGKAIGFIGYSGAGKSTLSAFCAGCGAGFVTDDVLVVDEQGYVLPGNPRIKLYPETGVSLGLEASQETNYKIFYHPEYNLGTTLHHAPVPLGKLYLLAEAETDQVYTEPIPSAQAVFELLTHGYDVSYFIARNPKLFDAYVHLVDQVPLRRLVYPHDFSRLPEVYALLLEES